MSDPPIDPHTPRQHVLPPSPVREVVGTYTRMNAIDGVVRDSVEVSWDSPLSATAVTLDQFLRGLGENAGFALVADQEARSGPNSPEWISKKARDTARSLLLKPFMAGLNGVLGLPEGYEG